jgi:hypothetical protein
LSALKTEAPSQQVIPPSQKVFTLPATLPTQETFRPETVSARTTPSIETIPTVAQSSLMETAPSQTSELSFEPQIFSPQVSEPSETFPTMQTQPAQTYEQPSIIQPFTLPVETEKISQPSIQQPFAMQEQPFTQPETSLIGMGEYPQTEIFQEQFSTQIFEPLLIQQATEEEYTQPSFQMTGTNILSTQEEKQNQIPILSMQNLLGQQGANTQAVIPRMEQIQRQTQRQEQILRQTQRLTTTTTSPTTTIPPIGIPPSPVIFRKRRGEDLRGLISYGQKGRAKGGKGKQKIMPFADLASITFSVAKYGKATLPRMTAQSVGKFREKYSRVGIAGS